VTPSRGLRRSLAGAFTTLLAQRAKRLGQSELEQSALVFSPHFDDETLGCGGTILRKRSLGAPVGIVFLTDGRASHRDWISESELTRTRTEEGIAAARALGLSDDQVHTLGFEETCLRAHADEAEARVREILRSVEPQQVFVPYRFEPPDDHADTFGIVSRALSSYERPVTIYEYPIWVWVQWPWTALPSGAPLRLPRLFFREARSLGRFLRDFRWQVETSELRGRKRQALEQHRSQLFRPPGRRDWPVLGDVSGGDFLECFFHEFEIFARTESGTNPGG
jgi:LmbE family N-acetylglucosaminyl deacetylase